MRKQLHMAFWAAFLLLVVTTACRRQLYVAGDEFHSLALDVDWRQYQGSDPDGMTTWFYPAGTDERCYRLTTAQVRHAELFLPAGQYNGVVIDYSPEEYGRLEFVGMEYASTAMAVATPASYQPESDSELYGTEAFHTRIQPMLEETGLSQVTSEPEMMAMDTLKNITVFGGDHGFYIPYEERDSYQTALQVKEYQMFPVTPLWRLRIRIYIKGYDYLGETTASIAGLSGGRFLALNRNSNVPCLMAIPSWESTRTGDNVGYIAATIYTFGLLYKQKPNTLEEPFTEEELAEMETPVIADWRGAAPLVPEDLRINLCFLLRDRATVMHYHYDVGDCLVSYDRQQVMRIDLEDGFPGLPDLPYVEPFNSAGFDAQVTPWEEGGNADVGM